MSTLTLGGITLNPNMSIPALNTSSSVSMDVRPTIGGGSVVYEQLKQSGISLQLTATENQGWVPKEARDQLLVEASKLGNVMQLIAGSHTYKVMFDHSSSAAVNLEPLINRLIPLDGDYFIGTINLITV